MVPNVAVSINAKGINPQLTSWKIKVPNFMVSNAEECKEHESITHPLKWCSQILL